MSNVDELTQDGLSRVEHTDCGEDTHVALEALVGGLRLAGMAVEDCSWHNDADPSVQVWVDADAAAAGAQAVARVWVVDPESEVNMDADTVGRPVHYVAYVEEAWPGGVYVSGEQVAAEMGMSYTLESRSIEEIGKFLRQVVAGYEGATAALMRGEGGVKVITSR